MRGLSFIVTVFSLWLGLIILGLSVAQASQCYCHVDPYSKQYAENGVVNHWWGGKRIWSCEYTCTTPRDGEVQIRGHHQKTYFGNDTGLWGICDGLNYEARFNAYINDYAYTLINERGLDPIKSTSPDLVKFAKEHCE
ncbi:MAG TPA: hypothetical protein VF412_07595 [Bdellovibrio sp.]|uniref:hypothetical protein n=1 Tax=Bdellovibrio sp. TaxID=28201 RepID=UPI002F177A96